MRLIKLDDAIEAITSTSGIRGDALKALYDLPFIESRPKGKWILANGKTSINCSRCYHCSWSLSFEDTEDDLTFCPYCGADMRGNEK